MKAKRSPLAPGGALRLRAEKRMPKKAPSAVAIASDAKMQRLLHELQIHQIELEMQNEELQHSRDKAEAERGKYSDLYDFAPISYMTLDRKGSIVETNLACATLLGIERSRLGGRRFGVFVSPTDAPVFNNYLAKVFQSGMRESCEVALVKEGHPPVEVRLEGAAASSGEECRVAMTDITEHNRAARDRLVMSKLESTGILAGGIAHDFNNLLTVILLNLEMGRVLSSPGGEVARHIEDAKKAALLARGLTQQIITFSKGGAPFRKPTLLSGVIRDSVGLALSGSNVRCEFSLAVDLWPADVDPGQIGQVIRNLVQNAREAMPEGGVVTVRAEKVVLGQQDITSLPPGEYVQVSIHDQGGGIPDDVLPSIFDPYFSTKQRGEQKGMGLGLTICHSVVTKHGGAMLVDSKAGVGTTFHIYLPASHEMMAPASAQEAGSMPRTGRILVMEDEDEVRTIVGEALRRMGHDVELVEDGERAIDAFGRAKNLGHPFDAVILDKTVRAGLGGAETIKALRKMESTVRAIVMSGHSRDPAVVDPARHGFQGALTKPFDSAKLQETLARVMGV